MAEVNPRYDCDDARDRFRGALTRLSAVTLEVMAANTAVGHELLAWRMQHEQSIVDEVTFEARAAGHWKCLGEPECRRAGGVAIAAA